MLDVANFGLVLSVGLFNHRLQSPLAVDEALLAYVLPFAEQEVEGKKDQVIGFPIRQGGLEAREIRRAAVVEGDDFSVHNAIRQLAGGPRYRAELGRPIEPLPGFQGNLTALNPHLNAVSVEFDLVDPIAPCRRSLDRSTQLRSDERGHPLIGS